MRNRIFLNGSAKQHFKNQSYQGEDKTQQNSKC